MKRTLLIWGTAVVLVVALVVILTAKKAGDSLISPPAVSGGQTVSTASGVKAGDFTLTDLNGSSVSLSALKGKNVYINFWTTWCPWCVSELPEINQIAKDYKDQNLVVLTIDSGEDNKTVQDFISKNNYEFTVLLDTDNTVSRQYGISSIPVSIFIDKDGNIVQKRIGAMTGDDMIAAIDQLLKD
jgi:peroxiredoxin